ncbi:GntR family transcriptional regulator [bacterium LRH843]|nr:GntR family transcriptional regulator [bacterium LRH843]
MSYQLPVETKSTLQNHVTNKLRQAILQGAFKKGERLIQEEWAAKLGVSRMPIRDALRQLELEGLIKIEPRKGAIVTPLSVNDVEEIYNLRIYLEGLAVEKALPYITKEDENEIEQLLKVMENMSLQPINVDYYVGLNKQFHRKLREKSPWRRVNQQVDLLWSGFLPFASPGLLNDFYQDAQKEHRLIFEAVKKKDTKMVQAMMRTHIQRNKMSLLSIMKLSYID